MTSKYDIGDKILLVGTVTGIIQRPGGGILYQVRECQASIEEGMVFGKVAQDWEVKPEKQTPEWF